MAQETEVPDVSDEELVRRIAALRRGIDDGTLPLWTGDESLPAYLDRARSLQR